VVAATIQIADPGEVNFGHCLCNVAGLVAGRALRISGQSASIYSRLVWDLSGQRRFASPGRIILDSWQCAALGTVDGAQVELTELDWAGLPVADLVEVRLLRWSGPQVEHTAGLPDFLRSHGYLFYPGLRFGYQPLGESGSGDFEVVAVTAQGAQVEVGRPGDALTHTVQRAPGVADWPPTYADIGGLDRAIEALRREVELPLRRPHDLRAIGITGASGMLLYGPPGTGKSMLVRAVAQHSGVSAVILSGPELASMAHAEAEQIIRAAFAPPDGDADAPRLVIIDDLDYLAPARTIPGSHAPLLGLLQRLLDEPGRPVVVATTSRRDDIDPVIRRLGRIGRQIPVPVPSEGDRRAILGIHTRSLPLAIELDDREEFLADLAQRTPGFVGADLETLCHEAGRIALRRAFPVGVLESSSPEAQAPLRIQASDWDDALTYVTPSALGEIVTDVPPTSFEDVAGLPDTVAALRERLILPLRRPGVFAAAGLRMERGLLLYGPPGTGKTLLARAVAHECGGRFLSVRGPELLTKWFGESEQAVRDLFDRARAAAPCVVFFDEIEAIARRRTGGSADGGAADRVVSQLLAEIDGLIDLGQVSIIGATNDWRLIDPALLRPGRLGLHIEVLLPDADGRRDLFAMYLPGTPPAEAAEYGALAQEMSGADIAMIGREARLIALRRANFEQAVPPVREDVLAAIEAHRGGGARSSLPGLPAWPGSGP
jgi:transitional endoplasmic reticulum ATPase